MTQWKHDRVRRARSTIFIAFVATVSSAARRTHQGLPVWLKRSVVIALTGICRPVDPCPSSGKEGHGFMVTFGVDAHKRTHTIVAVNDRGTPVGQTTVGTTSQDHLVLLRWAARFGAERRWAVEDCRHLSRRLERDLLAAGESIMRVPPKLMAHVRDSARTYGKSDPIDALAVARAAQREPNLPLARLDGPDREVRLLVDHRESLISERTRLICRLRWHLHELDPAWEPKARSLDAQRTLDEVRGRLQDHVGVVARLAVELTERCAELTITIKALEKEITELTTQLAPALLELPGCGALTAAKIIGETAGVDRFKSRDAYARFNGTAPLPVWSSNKARHRLSRTGNRQLNAALHRIALTQARWHPPAKGDDRTAQERWEQRTRGTSRTQAPPLRCRLSSPAPRPNRRPYPRRLTEEQVTYHDAKDVSVVCCRTPRSASRRRCAPALPVAYGQRRLGPSFGPWRGWVARFRRTRPCQDGGLRPTEDSACRSSRL